MEVNPALFERLHKAIDDNRKSDVVMLLRQIFNIQNKSDFDRDRDYLSALVDHGDLALANEHLDLAERYYLLALRLHETLFRANLTEGLAAARRYCELLQRCNRSGELDVALRRTFRIVKNMRGTLGAKRGVKNGTTGGVTIYSMARDGAADHNKKKPLRVLYVEDNPDDVELLKEALVPGDEPIIIEWTDHLQSAVQKLRAGQVDAVLLDLGLPDSAEVDTVRSINEEAPGVPIVVLTGSNDKDLAITSLKNGARDFLLKEKLNGAGVINALKRVVLQRQREVMQVRDREARLEVAREFVLNASRAMALVDVDMVMLEANPSFLRLFSVDQTVKGLGVLDCLPTFTKHEIESSFKNGGKSKASILSIDGTEIHQVTSWTLAGADGKAIALVCGIE